MAFIPLKHTLEVKREGEPVRDRFGDLIPSLASWATIPVASWWVDKTEEKQDDSILRTIDYLHLHCRPSDAPGEAEVVRTPDGREWAVQGRVEDYSHGWHGWDSGLVVVHCKGVAG